MNQTSKIFVAFAFCIAKNHFCLKWFMYKKTKNTEKSTKFEKLKYDSTAVKKDLNIITAQPV